MEQQKMAKQMIDFQKATFDNTFNAMVMVQEQGERMLNMALSQFPWVPEEGRRAIDEWMKAYKAGRDDFKKTMDENFEKVETFFGQNPEA